MSAPEPEAAGEFYDAMWSEYAHLDAVSPAAFHRRRLVVELARELAPGARRVLDAGCGTGDLLFDLAAAFPSAKVEGTDVSPRSIELSRAKNPGLELGVVDLVSPHFEASQAHRLGQYDLVVCSEVLEHIADDTLAASRVASLVAPGGAVIVTVPGGAMSRFDVAIGHIRHYRRGALHALLRGAGLEVDRVLAWGFPFHSAYRTMVRAASRFAIDPPKNNASSSHGASEPRPPSTVSRALGAAYGLVGRALLPAFYWNLDRFGEQMIGVARRPLR